MLFGPLVFGPCMIPSAWPSASRACKRAMAWLRSARMERVSRPWTVFASAHRCRPASVFGPVEAPPWNLHFVLPFEAGARHCCAVRLDVAWHWRHRMRPPAVTKVKLLDIDLHLVWGSRGGQKLINHRTSCAEISGVRQGPHQTGYLHHQSFGGRTLMCIKLHHCF